MKKNMFILIALLATFGRVNAGTVATVPVPLKQTAEKSLEALLTENPTIDMQGEKVRFSKVFAQMSLSSLSGGITGTGDMRVVQASCYPDHQDANTFNCSLVASKLEVAYNENERSWVSTEKERDYVSGLNYIFSPLKKRKISIESYEPEN